MTKFSIIICAYNARDRLGKTLEHICLLDYPADLVEIIVVDNNSTDYTAGFVASFWKNAGSPFPLRVANEKNQGLNHARKRGVLEAAFEYLVFCDDDNWLNSDYLKVADKILNTNKHIGVLGGQSIPVTDEERFPSWFFTYAGCFAVGVQGVDSGDISERGYIWGAGAIACRKPLEKIYSAGYDLLLSGRKGDSIAAGEDSEMSKWFLIAGYRLWYDERLILHHLISKARLNKDYLDRILNGMINSRNVLAYYDDYMFRQSVQTSWYIMSLQKLRNKISWLLDQNPERIHVESIARYIEKHACLVNICD